MARILCNWLVIGLLLAAPLAGHSQNPTPAGSIPALMWAATARYVYHDDPELHGIAPQLDATVQDGSVPAFNVGLSKAVALEKQQTKHQNLMKFQGIVSDLQQQKLDLSALGDGIITKLKGNAARMADPARKQQLAALQAELSRLALATTVAPAAAAQVPTPAAVAAAADTAAPLASPVAAPAAVTATPAPLPTPWAQRLALGLAALGLGGLAVLWNKHANLARSFRSYRERHHQSAPVPEADISGQVKREVERQLHAYLAKQAATSVAAAPAITAPAEALAAAPVLVLAAPPAPRVRRQYVSEAPLNRVLRAPADQPGPYSIFEVESTEEQPGEGRFTITGNQLNHIQNHRLVLEPVCEYVGGFPQGGETRLLIDQPGQVRRTPDGNWEVTQPARVRFGA